MEFTTQFQRKSERICSVPGSGMKDTFKMHVDENGKRELRKNGEYNLYAEIQSYKDSVSIEYILTRFMNGDDSALSRAQGIYGDFSEMPTTLAELQQRVIDAEDLFNSLPIDIRAQYNHSASEFFAQLDSEKTKNIFSPKVEDGLVVPKVVVEPPVVEPPVVKEVTPNA
uniref:Internal scaffolding protein n=1 Tax=Dulem virus 198 TaxID=3145675 RepID=A0AAU8AZ87_9VIRU